jgi:hypothetical protein
MTSVYSRMIVPIESFPESVLGRERDKALLFKRLATLVTEAPVFREVEELRWRGPTDGFPAWEGRLGDQRLLTRAAEATSGLDHA